MRRSPRTISTASILPSSHDAAGLRAGRHEPGFGPRRRCVDRVALAAGGRAQHGNVTVAADGSFVIRYTGDAARTTDRDSFAYDIADGFGGTARGVATILLNDARTRRPTDAASR